MNTPTAIITTPTVPTAMKTIIANAKAMLKLC